MSRSGQFPCNLASLLFKTYKFKEWINKQFVKAPWRKWIFLHIRSHVFMKMLHHDSHVQHFMITVHYKQWRVPQGHHWGATTPIQPKPVQHFMITVHYKQWRVPQGHHSPRGNNLTYLRSFPSFPIEYKIFASPARETWASSSRGFESCFDKQQSGCRGDARVCGK